MYGKSCAMSWVWATEFAEQLLQKYAKAKSADQACFNLLSANHGDIDAESIKLTRPCLLSESDLALSTSSGG